MLALGTTIAQNSILKNSNILNYKKVKNAPKYIKIITLQPKYNE